MKLYRFHYSPFARKVQMLLDLIGAKYEIVEVPYSDRSTLARIADGYIHVPVLDTGEAVITDSRRISEHLLTGSAGARLLPSPWEGPIWAYADFVEGPLEEALFPIAAPAIRDSWPELGDRALFQLIKERKYGAGCIENWKRDQPALITRARSMLAPTLRTLAQRPYLFGNEPTLADAALYGMCAMFETESSLLARVAEPLVDYKHRLEAAGGRSTRT